MNNVVDGGVIFLMIKLIQARERETKRMYLSENIKISLNPYLIVNNIVHG